MNFELVILLLVVFVAYLLSATFGFGDALILLPVLSIFIDIEIGIIFTGFWAFPQAVQQVIKYRQHLDKRYLLYFLPTVIPGIFLGIWFILFLDSKWMEIIIALFIIGYASYNFWQMKLHSEKQAPPEQANSLPPIVLGICGFTYGTISSWVGTPGPISVVLLEYTGHYRENFIANNTAIVVIAGVFKLSLYLINGLFPIDYLGLFLGGLAICLLATKLGHILTPKIPVHQFRVVLNGILLIAGFRMLWSHIF